MPIYRVLIVDDDNDTVELMGELLSRVDDFEVLTATSGASAIDIAVQKRPDAVVLDLVMPGTDGLSVLRALRRHAATVTTPVFVLTAGGIVDHTAAALAAGATGSS